MTDDTSLADTSKSAPENALNLAQYAQKAYLEYALSVVKGRALPDAHDGKKPVQRRILYAMMRMGLGFMGAQITTGARPVKSARVVGDVLGRFHPHGDQAAYDAMVRMAQDFSQRYPLIDGHGNFGSRDGDGAAAMRYTEARLSKISNLLLEEIDMGTVDFSPNYDGSTEEPGQLPARLPFSVLNGASGIAVGLATEIPSHNLKEVANACIALIEEPQLPDADLFALIPGPDYAAGAQIISRPEEIHEAYQTGRGSLKVRARWHIEDLARGQWKMVIDQLPPNVSSQRILEEIEELTNPKIKVGKKTLSPEQTRAKTLLLGVLDGVRDESDKSCAIRLVFEPKSRSVDQQEFITILLSHTSMECSCPINLTLIGTDGRPKQKSLREMLVEWISFREQTITRRSHHRLQHVLDRIHILEGRQLVLLNIDEVIAIIRQSDEPKDALMTRFSLSERQAQDILDIRLRQLAKLEAIKIGQELEGLRKEQSGLEEILASSAVLRCLMAKEIQQDAARFGDERRTLILTEKRTVLDVNKISDEPVTVIVSKKGWVKTRLGHGLAPDTLTVKAGDELYGSFECRSNDVLLAFGNHGRIYSIDVSTLPGGRADGQPITSMIDLESGAHIAHYFAGPAQTRLLLTSTAAYGFVATVENMTSRIRAGKSFVSCSDGESICKPVLFPGFSEQSSGEFDADLDATMQVACATREGYLLSFALNELKTLPKGGKGLQLMVVTEGDVFVGVCVYASTGKGVCLSGVGRSGKVRDETLSTRALSLTVGKRARKGKNINLTFKVEAIGCAI